MLISFLRAAQEGKDKILILFLVLGLVAKIYSIHTRAGPERQETTEHSWPVKLL